MDAGEIVEMGDDYAPIESKSEKIAAGWKKAAAEANASIGAGPSMNALGTGQLGAGPTAAAKLRGISLKGRVPASVEKRVAAEMAEAAKDIEAALAVAVLSGECDYGDD